MKPSQQIIDALQKEAGKQRLAIAFCPYKMAMWDCMEPVYYECRTLNGIRAEIIPLDFITYPDGRIHNERDAFLNAGINALPLKALHDNYYDYIIIHYPYDDHNNVTSMTPECCSDRLRQEGKLVYIPYHGNIAGPEYCRFFDKTGVHNSDYICLGSDADVESFRKTVPSYSGKIIHTAYSTKVECSEMHKNDPIPEQYKDLHHPVTLICGTLWTFTHNPTDRISKHWSVIRKELRARNTVIYRPHPLVREAVAVMRPEALAEYDQFIDIVSSNVILDRSPFLHHAIRVADKLICDPSSVQRTWQGTGKPIEVME